MLSNLQRALNRFRFMLDKMPYLMMHYTLGNTLIRLSIIRALTPFPRLEIFLRGSAIRIRQSFVKKRILYQRTLHPTMVLESRRQASPIRPESLIQVDAEPRSVAVILRQIDIELR